MIEFSVPDMSCGHCVASITRAVKELDAAGQVDIDLAAKRVRITSAKPAGELKAAIEEAGFTPVAAG